MVAAQKVNEWWAGVPSSIKALGAAGGVLVLAATVAFSAGKGVAAANGMPGIADSVRANARAIQRVRSDVDSLLPAVRFLACSQSRTNRGQDPRTCEDLMRGTYDFLPGR